MTPDTPEPRLPPLPEPGPDGHRHRSFGPTATHTDQCIQDAARFGFCDHTRLTVRPSQLRAQTEYRALSRRVRMLREVGSFAGLALTTFPLLYLTTHLPLAAAFLTFIAISTGWLLVFTCGIPTFLTQDVRDVLPPAAAARLRSQVAPSRVVRRRNRRPGG